MEAQLIMLVFPEEQFVYGNRSASGMSKTYLKGFYSALPSHMTFKVNYRIHQK